MSKIKNSIDLMKKIKKAKSPKKMMEILEWADKEKLLHWGYLYCGSFDCHDYYDEFCRKMFANIGAPPHSQIYFYDTKETDVRPMPE